MATKITYNRGTTFTITHVYQKDGVDSSDGIELLFTVKAAIDNDITDSQAIVKKNIAMSGATNSITLNPADIADTAPDGTYVGDIKIVESWGPPARIYPGGSFKFVLDVTATNRITAS